MNNELALNSNLYRPIRSKTKGRNNVPFTKTFAMIYFLKVPNWL